MKKENMKDYFSEAIKNIRNDRAVTTKLLIEIMDYLKGSETRHQEVGTTAAKYVETLQRSNEQLVKLVALLQKDGATKQGLTDEDKSEIFDLLKEAN